MDNFKCPACFQSGGVVVVGLEDDTLTCVCNECGEDFSVIYGVQDGYEEIIEDLLESETVEDFSESLLDLPPFRRRH
jgi:transcription elongation factor Elf1